MAKIKNKIKPIDAPLFGYWSALFLSFYSKRLYIDVGKRWSGYGIGYLVLLIVLWSVPLTVKMGLHFSELFNQQLIEPLSIIPTIYIQNGEATFDKPMPYFIKNKKNEVVLIVDTSGKVTDFTDKYPYLSVLINKDKVGFRVPGIQFVEGNEFAANPNKPLIQYFSKGENMVFDGKKITQQSFFSQWKYIAELMIYPITVVVFFCMFLFIFLVFGFLGQLVASIFFSFQITLKQGCRLLMVSATPMMLVLLGLLLLNATFPGFGFLLVSVLAVYFCFAVFSLKSESRVLVNNG